MKKVFLFALSICLAAALLIFCGSSSRESEAADTHNTQQTMAGTASPSPSPDEKVIRIGVPTSLTGIGSTDDARILLGLKYAHSVSPTVSIGSTSYKIELVEADDCGTVSGAQSAEKALCKQKPSAVIGSFSTQAAQSPLPGYSKSGVPVLTLCDRSGSADGASVFALSASDKTGGGAAASLAKSLEKSHAAVITDAADSSSLALGKAFDEAFTTLGGSCSDFTYDAGKKNFKALAQSVKASGADIVYMVSSAEDGQAFLRQARGEGVCCPVIGSAAWDAGLLLSDAGSYSDDVYVIAGYDGCGTDEVSGGFAARFSAWAEDSKDVKLKNGGSNYASTYSAASYDAYMLLVSAIKSAASTDPAAISDALKSSQYAGIAGQISFDKQGNAPRTVAFIKKLNRLKSSFELLRTVEIGG